MKRYRMPLAFCLLVAAITAAALAAHAAPGQIVAQPIPGAQLPSPAPDWGALLQTSDLVVRGVVEQTTSTWTSDNQQIVSASIVSVRYSLHGAAPEQVVVHTTGGTAPRPGDPTAAPISMLASGYPTLATHEEVILFLHRQDTGYRVVGRIAGKYMVANGTAVNSAYAMSLPLSDLYAALAAVDPTVGVPANWQQVESAVHPEPVVGGLDYEYKGIKWAASHVAYKVNINSRHIGGEHGSAADYLAAIQNAAMTWTLEPKADFYLDYAGETASTTVGFNQANDIFFMDAGLDDEDGNPQPLAVAHVTFTGTRILDCDIWINDAFDWSATDVLTDHDPDLQSVLLHELGHWLSLGHDDDPAAVMYPSYTLGATKRELYTTDRAGIEFIYPCAADACNPEPTPTPTATPSPTPTLTPTPTATPTATATPKPVTLDIGPELGGDMTLSISNGLQVQIAAPAGSVGITTTLIMRDSLPASEEPLGRRSLEHFKLVAARGEEELTELEFVHPLTLTVHYTDAALNGLNEASLDVYEFSTTANTWRAGDCGQADRDLDQNDVNLPICHLATFDIAGEPNGVFLPTILQP